MGVRDELLAVGDEAEQDDAEDGALGIGVDWDDALRGEGAQQWLAVTRQPPPVKRATMQTTHERRVRGCDSHSRGSKDEDETPTLPIYTLSMPNLLGTMQAVAYNASSRGQLAAHRLVDPALRAALSRLARRSAACDGPLRVCDFGAAGGANALEVARSVLSDLEELGEEDREVEYAFNDLPASDFNELFRTLHAASLPPRVHTSAIARSFYERCFPEGSLQLALSYITLHWMSEAPITSRLGPGAILPNESGVPEVSAILKRTGAANKTRGELLSK